MDDVKNLILDQAKKRFDRFGYKKTTMDEISRDCKISKKTVYEVFKDKEDLFTSLFRRECEVVNEFLLDRLKGISDPVEKITVLAKTAIWYFNQDNFLTRLLKDDEAIFSAFLTTKYHNFADSSILKLIADIIKEGKLQGKFRDVDEQMVAYMGLKLCNALSYMRTIEFSPEKEKQGYYTDVLIDFVMNGLLKK